MVLIKDFGEIQTMLPSIDTPFFDMRVMNTLLPIGFAIALLGILEATSIARSIAAQTGQVLSINQEIFAIIAFILAVVVCHFTHLCHPDANRRHSHTKKKFSTAEVE